MIATVHIVSVLLGPVKQRNNVQSLPFANWYTASKIISKLEKGKLKKIYEYGEMACDSCAEIGYGELS